MTKRYIDDYLQDILDAITDSQQFISGMTFAEFESDRKTILRQLVPLKLLVKQSKASLKTFSTNIQRFLGKALQECETNSFINTLV